MIRPPIGRFARRRAPLWLLAAAVLGGLPGGDGLLAPSPCWALSPESPEVRKLIDAGLKALEEVEHDAQLGAGCLSAIAFIKDGQRSHPRIGQAVSQCARVASNKDEFQALDNYSFGLALILLCEDRSDDHERLLRVYLDELLRRQKPNGGWGYSYSNAGDTSQTQYMALGLWEAHVSGYPMPAETVRGLVNWLINTQDPNGGWGYQGVLAEGDQLAAQSQISCTMAAAALGSLMIAADVCGKLRATKAEINGESDELPEELPSGVTRAKIGEKERGRARDISAAVAWKRAFETIDNGDRWMDKNFELPAKKYPIYYLYALERYKSFQEFRSGAIDPDPEWYRSGYEQLKETQAASGLWNASCGQEADTALAVLFLLRSTQRSIQERIGEGTLVSGRGLPKHLSGARFSGGRVIAELPPTDVEGFLEILDQEDADRLDSLAEDPAALNLEAIKQEDLRRLKQLLRSGGPSARYVAATALGRLASLDNVPDLLYAMTDPERRVVLAADDALREISRRSRGFGLEDDFDDAARFATIDRWKRWYLGIRPGAPLE
ncbi:prenyltransferase/squalene oxidase repeat-containing protein [Botrimarina hoheduenensis]|uniref:Prenyltransferase and squalene oxidase repeat protein n=1 Tax=Botrimarina hoheduenensis TaxID=2528000 RepID=A0A5C5VVC8_9BACT|nr:prenyltransferase/squalene oxidase repeat-containing protein [Botrimarina hoheduenensis]TWT42564.1 Prenyltransferase and squalene oxidase repeat protein [Botrimarina hoheduenensis]